MVMKQQIYKAENCGLECQYKLKTHRPKSHSNSVRWRRLSIQYPPVSGPSDHGPARRAVTSLLANFSLPAFSHSKVYLAWETDNTIAWELWRNVGLAVLCILLTSLLLLANLRVCLAILATVLATLTDIIGFLHFWGVTIDIVSSINLVIAVGLCVDYSVHVAHAYTVSGSGVAAVRSIGPAVVQGGLSSLLALVTTAASHSHIFRTFFRVFSLTVLFGLWHGLLLLPVLLHGLGCTAARARPARPDILQHVPPTAPAASPQQICHT